MKSLFKSVVWLSIAAIAAPTASLAQGFPMPGSSSKPPVICPSCGNLPTYPYSEPILAHRGRFLDSTKVRELQAPVRTFRAERVAIVPERDRIYMKFGSALVSYRLSTFFTQDLSVPMTGISARSPGEQYLPYLDWVYPEKQGWMTVFADGQERMGPGFDWDDRGYVYIPVKIFGWGIVKDVNGVFSLVKQYGGPLGGPGSGVGPTGTISFKHGGKYYVFVYDSAGISGALFDVTDPAKATYVKPLNHSIRNFAKTTIGGSDVIAYTDVNAGDIKIFSAASFFAGAGAEKVIAAGSGLRFLAIASDGTRFFGAEGSASAPGNIAIIGPNGNSVHSYGADRFPVPGDRFSPSSISYSQDVVTTVGYVGGGNGVHMFRLVGGTPRYVDFKDFFKKYYSGTAEDGKQYADAPFCHLVNDGVFYRDGSKEYVIYAANGLGDVYQIQAADEIRIERDGTVGNGTPNPYSEGESGPYYGDVFRFKTACTGSATAIDVDYGNPESAAGNIVPATTGEPLSYRYSGLNNASKIQQTRTVKITRAGNASEMASVHVTMSVPTARVRGWRSTGIKDPALLFIQPNAAAAAPLVVGDSFVDASDGSVESHFSSWTLDDAAAANQVPNVPFSVGQCGTHTLSLKATYGAYDSFVSRSSGDYSVGVSNISYAVRPFATRIAVVSSDASGIRFRPDTRVSAAAVAGGAGAAATITWDLLNGSGGVIRSTDAVASTLGNTAEFAVSPNELTTGNSVRLTVALTDPAALVAAGCAGMTQSSQTFTLTQNACSWAISPPSRSVTAAAATGSIAVTTECAWTATTNDSWITLTGTTSGTGNGTVSYSAAANTASSARTGTITISGQTFNLEQQGAVSGDLDSNGTVSESDLNALITLIQSNDGSKPGTGAPDCDGNGIVNGADLVCVYNMVFPESGTQTSILDLDRTGSNGALTDGLLLLRKLFGFSGSTLVQSAVGSGAVRTTGTDVEAYANRMALVFDIDGDGLVQPLTDGLLILRYMFGFTGPTLTNGAVGAGATRTTPAEIEAYLAGL